MAAESFTLSALDLSSAGKDGKPITLGDIMKQVMVKHKVKLEASTNQKTRQTTFALKSESTKELDKAKRTLLALLSPVVSTTPPCIFNLANAHQVTLVINAPASTIASIIGQKGLNIALSSQHPLKNIPQARLSNTSASKRVLKSTFLVGTP